MKNFIFLLIFFFLPVAIFAQQQQGETINISSYYPSPYGIYKTLRFYPNDNYNYAEGTSCANAGEMYYDNSENRLYICVGSPSTWQRFGAGGVSYIPNPNPPYLQLEVPWNIGSFTTITLPDAPASARFAMVYIRSLEDAETYLTFADMSGTIFGRAGDGCNSNSAITSGGDGYQHFYDPSNYTSDPATFAIVPLTNRQFKMNLGRFGSGTGTIYVYRLGYIE